MKYLVARKNIRVVIIAPHCDDMAFSLGGSLLAHSLGARPLIINCFNTSSFSQIKSECGHITKTTARRRREELTAAHKVGAETVFLNLKDAIDRNEPDRSAGIFSRSFVPERDPVFAELRHSLTQLYKKYRAQLWLFPLGIGYHLDHQLARAVGRQLLIDQDPAPLGFYQDLPYAANHLSLAIINRVQKTTNIKLVSLKLRAAPVERKLELLDIYKSQMTDVERKTLRKFHTRNPYEQIWVAQPCAGLFKVV